MPQRWEMPATFLRSGDPTTENEPTLQYKGQLGMRLTIPQPSRGVSSGSRLAATTKSKTYQVVKTDSTMTVAPFSGAVAWWSDKSQYLVTTNAAQTATGRGRIAGIFANAITPGNFGCIQTEGPCIVKFIDSPTAAPTSAGLFVIPSSTNAKADCVSAAPTFPILGYTAGAITGADSTALVDLDVPQTT